MVQLWCNYGAIMVRKLLSPRCALFELKFEGCSTRSTNDKNGLRVMKKWLETTMYAIEDFQSEPHHKNQNFFERWWQVIK